MTKLGQLIDDRGKQRSIKEWMVLEAKNRPCADCRHGFHSSVMEFDHLPQFEKLFNIAQWRQHNRKEIRAEIAKCEVVCANCHRLRTWERSHE